MKKFLSVDHMLAHIENFLSNNKGTVIDRARWRTEHDGSCFVVGYESDYSMVSARYLVDTEDKGDLDRALNTILEWRNK